MRQQVILKEILVITSIMFLIIISNVFPVNAIKLTGNQAEDIIIVAEAQIGKGYATFGLQDNWCARFVWWCAKEAGISSEIIHRYSDFATCEDLIGDPNLYYPRKSGYIPKRGDLVFYANWDSKTGKYKEYPEGTYAHGSHVGIILEVKNGYIHTIEGNTGYADPNQIYWKTSQVAYHQYALTNEYIQGYGTPNYDTYTIQYNANGGSGAPAFQTKTRNVDLTLSSTVPTKTGYTFLGWSTDPNAKTATYAKGAKFKSNAATTLYAIWKLNEFTVTYNLNGGSGNVANQIKLYGKDLTLSNITPVRTDYKFLGWSNHEKGSVKYQQNSKYTDNSNITLYAIWKRPVSTSYISIQETYLTNTAILKGTLDDIYEPISEYGFYYGTDENNLKKVQLGNNPKLPSEFSYELTNLTPATEYVYKAYAITKAGIKYDGLVLNFITKAVVTPDVETSITENLVSGKIFYNGYSPITSYGFYYGTSEEELNNKIEIGTENPIYIETLYGDVDEDDEVNIKDVTAIQKHIAKVAMLTSDKAKNNADFNKDNRIDITDATAIQKALAGAATLTQNYYFSYDLENLEPNTTYFVRAYAENAKGEGFGAIFSFKKPEIATLDEI